MSLHFGYEERSEKCSFLVLKYNYAQVLEPRV